MHKIEVFTSIIVSTRDILCLCKKNKKASCSRLMALSTFQDDQPTMKYDINVMQWWLK